MALRKSHFLFNKWFFKLFNHPVLFFFHQVALISSNARYICIVMHNVCCNMHFKLHEPKKQHLQGSHVLCVCPLARHWCVCCVAGCLVASQAPLQKQRLQPDVYLCLWACVYVCVCGFFLTLDVYLLHLIDFCDSFPKLFCKFPELFSAWGAEAHQLLLLWGKGAQHGDAMCVVWQQKTGKKWLSLRIWHWRRVLKPLGVALFSYDSQG